MDSPRPPAPAPARIAVVGTGWWASEAHLPAIAAHPDARLVGVVDADRERRERAAAGFGPCPAFASVEQLIASESFDGAVVATPSHLHHETAAPLLDAGVHVLVEKPLAIEPGEARDLVERALRAGVELIVGYPLHYNAQLAEVRAALADGRIGPLELANVIFASIVREMYRGTPEVYREHLGDPDTAPAAATYSDPRGGGQAQSQLTHAIALLLWLTGLRPASVAGFTESFELGVDLADAATVRFESGALAAFASTGGLTRPHEEIFECTLFGHDGHVELDLQRGTASIRDASGVVRLPTLEDPKARYPQEAPARNLVEVVLGREPNRSPASLGAAVVELLDGLRRSQLSGGTISLLSG